MTTPDISSSSSPSFRGPPVSLNDEQLAKGGVTAHPSFSILKYNSALPSLDHVKLCRCDPPCSRNSAYCPNFDRLLDSSDGNENATSPGVARLYLHIAQYNGIEITSTATTATTAEDGHGASVTVLDVMQKLREFMAERVTASVDTRGEMYSWLGKKWDGVERVEVKDGQVRLYVYGKE